jgi:hypothetical protein
MNERPSHLRYAMAYPPDLLKDEEVLTDTPKPTGNSSNELDIKDSVEDSSSVEVVTSRIPHEQQTTIDAITSKLANWEEVYSKKDTDSVKKQKALSFLKVDLAKWQKVATMINSLHASPSPQRLGELEDLLRSHLANITRHVEVIEPTSVVITKANVEPTPVVTAEVTVESQAQSGMYDPGLEAEWPDLAEATERGDFRKNMEIALDTALKVAKTVEQKNSAHAFEVMFERQINQPLTPKSKKVLENHIANLYVLAETFAADAEMPEVVAQTADGSLPIVSTEVIRVQKGVEQSKWAALWKRLRTMPKSVRLTIAAAVVALGVSALPDNEKQTTTDTDIISADLGVQGADMSMGVPGLASVDPLPSETTAVLEPQSVVDQPQTELMETVATKVTPEEPVAETTAEDISVTTSDVSPLAETPVVEYVPAVEQTDTLPAIISSPEVLPVEYATTVVYGEPSTFPDRVLDTLFATVDTTGIPDDEVAQIKGRVKHEFYADAEALEAAGFSSGNHELVYAGEVIKYDEPMREYLTAIMAAKGAHEAVPVVPEGAILVTENDTLTNLVVEQNADLLGTIPAEEKATLAYTALEKYVTTVPGALATIGVTDIDTIKPGQLVQLDGIRPFIEELVQQNEVNSESEAADSTNTIDGETLINTVEAVDKVSPVSSVKTSDVVEAERTPATYPEGELAYSRDYNALLDKLGIAIKDPSIFDSAFTQSGPTSRALLSYTIGTFTSLMFYMRIEDREEALRTDGINPKVASDTYQLLKDLVKQGKIESTLDSTNTKTVAEVLREAVLSGSIK